MWCELYYADSHFRAGRLAQFCQCIKVQDGYVSSWLSLAFTVLKVDSPDVRPIPPHRQSYSPSIYVYITAHHIHTETMANEV